MGQPSLGCTLWKRRGFPKWIFSLFCKHQSPVLAIPDGMLLDCIIHSLPSSAICVEHHLACTDDPGHSCEHVLQKSTWSHCLGALRLSCIFPLCRFSASLVTRGHCVGLQLLSQHPVQLLPSFFICFLHYTPPPRPICSESETRQLGLWRSVC